MEDDIEKAEDELQKVLARLSRLRKHRRLLASRGDELFVRGMRELDEEDGVRTQEEAILEEQQAVGDAQSMGAFGVIDWTAVGLDDSLVSGPSAVVDDNFLSGAGSG